MQSRPAPADCYPIKRIPLGGLCLVGLGIALVIGCSPATAKSRIKFKLAHRDLVQVAKEPFGDIPKGPLQIFISIDQQKLYLYSDGALVANTSIATGVPSLPTPLGVFSVIQKQIFHRSNIYSNAPMPFMQRITWSGVAMHEGEGIGHRASHGCIRMPHDFAMRLYRLTKLGARVIIAQNELRPVEIADAHLFVHKDMPPAAAVAPTVQTAQSVDSRKATDAGPALDSSAPVPTSVSPPLGDSPVANAPGESDPAASQTPAAAMQPAADTGTPAFAPTPAATAGKPADTVELGTDQLRGSSDTVPNATDSGDQDTMPLPTPKPISPVAAAAAKHAPISIFVSRKTKRIYVRQDFAPLFDAPITIESPDRPLGTHVFTAMGYLNDGATFHWNVVSVPDAPPTAARIEKGRKFERSARGRRREELERPIAEPLPSETAEQVLARIEIPQEVIDQISELMVPGSSFVVSDQGLGPETGEGTDFIVVTH